MIGCRIGVMSFNDFCPIHGDGNLDEVDENNNDDDDDDNDNIVGHWAL